MSTFLKIYCVLVGVWLLSTFGVFVFPHSVELAGFWALFVILIGFLLTLTALIVFIIALFKKRDFKSPLLAIVLVAATTWFLWANELSFGVRLHFYLYRNHYESVVKKLSTTSNADERQQICGEECMILRSEPLRISFHYAHGFLNWKDIVYDPMGEVGSLNSTHPEERYKINVYFIRAEKITDNWYLGYFGD